MLKKLANLIDVKSIISIFAAVVFLVLALRGDLGVDNTMVILALVFQSFFSFQTHKNDKEEKDGE